MQALVFVGPTLPAELARELLPGALVRDPVRCGDVYRACAAGRRIIVLIDGYFEHALSVWHKEIWWALSQGARIYGAASMGALRAAELEPFGMIGVGRIFEAFRDGELSDDDEVAVVHEPAERGFVPRSEAMVNIRATLRRAVEQGVISRKTEARLIATGKALFYPRRTFPALFEAARGQVPERQLGRLAAWIAREGVVDQKRVDAVALLERVKRDLLLGHAAVPAACPEFEITDAWQALRARLDQGGAAANVAPHAAERESPPKSPASSHPELMPAALERAMALLLAQLQRVSPEPAEVQMESEALRRNLGLLTPQATLDWLDANGLDLVTFSSLAHDQVLVRRFAEQARRAALREIPALLRLRGDTSRSGRDRLS